MGEGTRREVLVERRAVGAGPHRRQRTDVNQADTGAGDRLGQNRRGARVAGVVILGAERLGDARQVDHGSDARESAVEAFTGFKRRLDGGGARRQGAARGVAAHQAAEGLASGGEPVEQVAAHEPGGAGH